MSFIRFKQYSGEKCAVCEQQSQRVYNRRALNAKRVSLCDDCHRVTVAQALRAMNAALHSLSKLNAHQLSLLQQALQ